MTMAEIESSIYAESRAGPKQVETLITAGHDILNANAEFERSVSDIEQSDRPGARQGR
jgi:hypothetical protein